VALAHRHERPHYDGAIAALPHRNGLDDEPRAALDEAFRARAAAISANPDLVLAFAENAPAGEAPSRQPRIQETIMRRTLPFDRSAAAPPARLKAEIPAALNGTCTDCGALDPGFSFRSSPALGVRRRREANDPERLPPFASAATSARRRRT
jgi:hypothetical protein